MQLLTLKEASQWASRHTGKTVTASNIAYLVQYGRIRKINGSGVLQVAKEELIAYYSDYRAQRADAWQRQLGQELNWALSFEQYKEAETTKHVHRLHPYKGKFIPQLVEYFLDSHTDSFKKTVYFHPGDIVLDPFCGSGTTMVQACELGIHCIGLDISAFNALISNAKVARYDIADIQREINRITMVLQDFVQASPLRPLEAALQKELTAFNQRFFPAPDYKYQLRQKTIDEKIYGAEKEKQFLAIYDRLLRQYEVWLVSEQADSFLDKWFSLPVREEIALVFREIKKIKAIKTKKIASIILSRTVRSCRATTHADLATLVQPVHTSYYCAKHGKVCRPLLSIYKWWNTYAKDTIKRLQQFDQLRTPTAQYCITGDSRKTDIMEKIKPVNADFYRLAKRQKIRGIFSSPPYVGLIDYHEQHAYAYDLFGWARHDGREIGALSKGQTKSAREAYVIGISEVLRHCVKYMVTDYDVFLVANDKFNLYPLIAEQAGMVIADRFNRPVLNRTEKDKRAYSETIFHLRRTS